MLAELLDNQEGLFDSEEDDVSTTNDYSSINEQVPAVTSVPHLLTFSVHRQVNLLKTLSEHGKYGTWSHLCYT